MRAFTVVAASAGCAVLLAACSSSTGGSDSGTAVGDTSSSRSSTSSSPSSSSSSGSGVAVTHVDPCKLVTRAEASKLAGASLSAGKEQTNSGAKSCVYGGQTTNVFTVEVVQAASADVANAQWNAEQAQAQDVLKKAVPAGLNVQLDTSNLSGIGDRAAAVRASTKIAGQTFSVSGIYVLKGSTFFAFQDLAFGRASTSESDLKDEAKTVLGRI
jgi:uncharacterized protein DUF3558